MGYNVDMRKIIILCLTILLSSCVYYGSGIRTVTGSIGGTVPANLKIGVFAETVTFKYDNFTPGDPDRVYMDHLDNYFGSGTSVTYTPVVLATLDTATTYTITLPSDPSTIKCLIAWDDVLNDNIFDIENESAYLPVKNIFNVDSVVNFFDYIELAQVITYISNYSALTLYTGNYIPISYSTDNFDAIGADGFNFIFD